MTVGWSVEIFLIGQNRSAIQRSGMILEVQIHIFGAHYRMRIKVFIFKKFPGAQILIFSDENWHAASFYIKEQTQKYKFGIWRFKKYHFGPPKKWVFNLWRKPQTFFSSCFGFDSALKTIDAHMFFWPVFLKTHKKIYWPSKTPF